MPIQRLPTAVYQSPQTSSLQGYVRGSPMDYSGNACGLGLSDILIPCCMETQSATDYRIMRMKLKDSLRPFGLVHLLDQPEVTDTFKLFEVVFSNGHSQVTDSEKLVLLEGLMKATGKHHMAVQVRQLQRYQPHATSMEPAQGTYSFHSIHPPRSSLPGKAINTIFL